MATDTLIMNKSLTLPFDKRRIERFIEQYPTPFHIYDEKAIREAARSLNRAFSWAPGFKEYFAVKATPNPFILKILKDEGCGTDCSSLAELLLSEKVDILGAEIMFTSNDTPEIEFAKAMELGAVINLDDITHIRTLEQCAALPELLSFRFNPGPLRSGNSIIGHPEESKYGLTREQIFEAYREVRDKGVKRFALHTMIASNELNPAYFIETAEMLLDLVIELHRELGIRCELINLGGGMGIPYAPEQEPLDFAAIGEEVRKLYEKKIDATDLHPLRICTENGRMITGPAGFLVAKTLHIKRTYRDYVGLDASMSDLMRPAMYGAYHHVTVLGKEDAPPTEVYDVTGSLCENNDKFAIQRALPPVAVGDLIVIHDTGAHGHSMGFNYNGKLRSAEFLLRSDGGIEQIRRAETLDDHFATLDFGRVESFDSSEPAVGG